MRRGLNQHTAHRMGRLSLAVVVYGLTAMDCDEIALLVEGRGRVVDLVVLRQLGNRACAPVRSESAI